MREGEDICKVCWKDSPRGCGCTLGSVLGLTQVTSLGFVFLLLNEELAFHNCHM